MKSLPNTYTSKKYCLFYKDKGHDTDDCYILKKKVERLITKDYFYLFFKDSHLE